jgi:bifunctional non-homologous end joining protein LigD
LEQAGLATTHPPSPQNVMAETTLNKKMRAFDDEVALTIAPFYLVRMLQRTFPAGFIAPCLPTKTTTLPSGGQWMHEIKHDGFRIIARKSNGRVRLYSRPGNDFTRRFPLIVEALARLRSRSCIIDGEAVACDDNGVASFDLVRHHRANDSVFLYAFDLIELNGADLRRDPLEVRKATLASVLAKAGPGIRFNEHIVPTARPSLPMPARWGSKALSRSARIPPTVLAARPIGSR